MATQEINTSTDRKEIVQRYARLVDDPKILFQPIPERELNSALQKYASDADSDAVLAVVDNTVSAGAKEGLVLTGTHLYGRQAGEKPKCIELSDIETAAAKGRLNKSLVVNGSRFVSLGCPKLASIEMFARMLEELAAIPPVETKVCPDCAEEIKAAAEICRFCGHRFEETRSERPPAAAIDASGATTPPKGFWAGVRTGAQVARDERRVAATTFEKHAEEPLRNAAEPTRGWQKFETEKLELCLPDTYVGGDPRRDKRGMLERSKEVGPEFHALMKTLIKQLRRTEERVDGWFGALDSAGGARPAEVRLVCERIGWTKRNVSAQTYVEKGWNPRFGQRIPVLERSTVRLGPYESERVVLEVAENRRLLMYVVKGRKEFCSLAYGADAEEWDRLLPIFEESAATLELKKVEPA